MRLSLILAPILLAGPSAAVEDYWPHDDPFVDIRIGVATVPIPGEYQVTADLTPEAGGGTVEYTDHMDEDRATSFSYTIVGGHLDPLGPLFGLELVHTVATQNLASRTRDGSITPAHPSPSSLQYRTLGGNLLAGMGLRFGPHFHVEAMGLAGLGSLDLDFSNEPGTEQADGNGSYWTIGGRAGAYVTYRRLVLGLSLDYSRVTFEAQQDWSDARTSSEGETTGFGARIELGYHIQ